MEKPRETTQGDSNLRESPNLVKHVDTELIFWRRPENQCMVIDFTSSKPEECMAAAAKMDEKRPVRIHDIRGQESQFSLEENGFEYVQHDIPAMDKISESGYADKVIIPKTEELVQRITGATRTITFAHRVRCLATDNALLANNRAPAHSVHSDFTATGALHHLETVVPEAAERESILRGRVRIINAWRPLKAVQKDPLAVCDWQTLDWRRDSIANRIILPHGWNELGKYVFDNTQTWYYLSGQQPHEPVVFSQFDSARVGEGGLTLPHSAFVDPDFVDSPARESIEIKMFAFG
ncbi:hypothetical protein NUU61_006187 [Penicillium alfredii]|uniref:Methyltransferase n=1 Tax=Penicillium alfredii TaxID=1506179 RepID=A0A9W9F0H1_9EURO|nr:uncharacterized protein NUU61_006187 [Penicillium alfredii]KAJ5091317.1 hypothetical protein NUU61_006187 [Penicillium alfredii]